MFAKKTFVGLANSALCLTLLLTVQTVDAQTTAAGSNAQTNASSANKEKKTNEVAPEIKEKAVGLLVAVAEEAGQFAAPENRVYAQIHAAEMLWEHNEKEARKLFQNVFGELQAMFNDVAVSQSDENSVNKNYSQRYKLSQLRSAYLLALAPRDPRSALAALQSLKTPAPSSEEYDPLKADNLELEIASALAKKDPQQSYDIAAKSLKDGVTYNTMTTLTDLYKNDAELGAKFARDILTKFKTAKIRRNPNSNGDISNAATNAATTVASGSDNAAFYAELSQITSFLQTAATLSRQSQKSSDKKTPLLTDGEMRELSDFIGQVFLKQSSDQTWAVASVMPVIAKYSPTAAGLIRGKLSAEQLKAIGSIGESSQYYADLDVKTADEIVTEAEKLPLADRDARYADAIGKALEKDELEKAQEIAAKIKERKNYEYLFEQIKTNAPVIKARRGDIGEVRKMLATLKDANEKVSALTELILALADKGDKEAVGKLLEEAAQFSPGHLKSKTNLDATLRIANAFAAARSEQSFNLLENSIAQANDVIAAGVLVNNFYEYETIANDEVLFETMMRQGLLQTTNTASLIKNLATTDFERTVALADKFARPEIRTFARLNIAMFLLDADAAEREKALRQQYQNQDEH